ncbi:MAG: hypothetical protein IPM24_22420 [Bryobacterales bacterium]|nr:hypothetical protein [Bryobacterales bacterium]
MRFVWSAASDFRIPLALILFGLFSLPAVSQEETAREIEKAVEVFRQETRELGIHPEGPRRRPGGPSPLSQYHGRVYGNLRNEFFDAVRKEVKQRGEPKQLLRRNQFGFNVAGPLYIPKIYNGGRRTFVSLSYEGVRERIARNFLRTIPTMIERTGDYSTIVDAAGNILPIFDPATTSPNPTFDRSRPISRDNIENNRQQFPGNIIPRSRLDPVALAAIELYPAPNTDVGPFFRNNYFINTPEENRANGMIGKLDHTFDDHHRVSTELAFSNGFHGSARWFPSIANPGPADRLDSSLRGSLDHVYTVSPQTVNTATFSSSSNVNQNVAEEFPVYNFSGYLSMGRSWPVSRNARNTYGFTDVLSTRRGKHSLRLVGQLYRYEVNTFWPQYPAGIFRFSPGLTSLPGIVNTGHGFASFLLGQAESAERSIVPQPSYFRRSSQHLSLRDQYEFRQGLTFTISLSLDRYTPRVEKFDRQSTIDLSAVNPETGRRGALVAANRGGYGRAFQPSYFRASPSFSVAWSPGGSAKTVLRGSYSRSYSPFPIYTSAWGTQGFSAYQLLLSQNVQLEPAVILAQGFPDAPRLPDLRPGAADDTVADLMFTSRQFPTYQSASVSVQREVGWATVVTAGASYSGGKNLLMSNAAAQPNAIHPDTLAFRDRLNDIDFNRSLRPFPQFQGFDVYSAWPDGRYKSDGVFVRAEKRASQGFSISASYQFYKQLDDYSGPGGRQDFFNRNNEWSQTNGHEPHRLQFSYVYELPIGGNKPFLRTSDWTRHIFDGWSLTGVAVVSSGNPLTLEPMFNNTGDVIRTLRVNVVPGVEPRVSNPGPELWFNPNAFAQPDDFSMGDAARTHPYLRNPLRQNYDLTVNKRVSLSPDRTLEFSAAGFNFINHANWNTPDTQIGPANAPNVNAGKIIGSVGGRVIQLGLRLSF